MRNGNTFASLVFATFLILLPTSILKAQTGAFTGKIVAQDGGVVAATVTATEGATSIVHSTHTSDDGLYTLPALPPGSYTVDVSSDGFAHSVRKDVVLHVEQTLRLDFTLKIGTVNETVIVSAETPQLATETSSIGQVVSGREVVTLPLLGRDAYALAELVPGVRSSIGMNQLPVDVISTSSISINGAQSTTNDFLLDGAPNSSPAFNQPVIYPIADTVQEFRVQTNNYSAEFGRAAGGIFDVVTKAGTNDIHFTGWEFYRNGTLGANNWFSKAAGQAAPPLSFHQFGGTLSAPVVIPHIYNGHNRTFLFFGTEFVRFRQGVTFTSTLPDPTKLTGDFSSDFNNSGQPITIYNPFSTRSNARTAFSGNKIPSNLLNPVAVAMAKFFPKPNFTGSGSTNYVLSTSNNIHENEYSLRLDQILTDKTSLFGRYSWNDTTVIRPNPFGPGNLGGPAYGPQLFKRKNIVSQFTHVFTPTLLATLRISGARLTNQRTPASLGFDISTLGFPSNLANEIGPPAAFPAIIIAGISTSSSVPNLSVASSLGGIGEIAGYLNTTAMMGSVIKTINHHTLKAGTDLRLMRANILQSPDTAVSYNYTAAFTQGPNATQASTTSGDALASFLLGATSSASVIPAIALSIQTKYSAVYLQDDWKATDKLTFNLGFRYEYETPFTERHDRLTNFTPDAPVPLTGVANLHGALTFVGVNGTNRYDSTAYADHFEPRFGFAWHVLPNTVVHGGGGLFYATLWGSSGQQPSSYGISGFTAATTMVTSLNSVTPYNLLSNPYPSGLNPVSGSSLGNATLLGQSVTGTLRTLKAPYAAQWNFGVEQQLAPKLTLDMTYVGTQGHHEPNNRPINQLPLSALSLGTGLNTLVTNPFYGQIATGQLAQPTVSRGQLLRPYPQFLDITAANQSGTSSRFNALEVMLQQRLSHGFSLQLAYTWSKMLDQGAGNFGGETLGGSVIQNYYNLSSEMSISTLDQTNRVVGSIIYQLPFFQSQHGLGGRLLGGWTISALPSFVSGGPLGFSTATNSTGSINGGQRPNWNGQNPVLSGRKVSKWFNTSVFSAPTAFTFGNSPRTFSFLRSDWTRNIDTSLQKTVLIVRELEAQIRVEAFNIDNTPQFAPPNTSFGNANFGVVNAQQNQPRAIQFGIKAEY
jgi:outer membrane receptor protein involved in Fe transport